jgi:hypothetical protein
MDRCPHCDGELTWPKPRCLWCDREAVAYCDAAFGQTMKDCHDVPGGRRVFDLGAPFFTCDAPMCAEHRKIAGFVCGKDPDTMDHCPVHAADEGLPHLDITADQAEGMRRAVHAAARRSRMATV